MASILVRTCNYLLSCNKRPNLTLCFIGQLALIVSIHCLLPSKGDLCQVCSGIPPCSGTMKEDFCSCISWLINFSEVPPIFPSILFAILQNVVSIIMFTGLMHTPSQLLDIQNPLTFCRLALLLATVA